MTAEHTLAPALDPDAATTLVTTLRGLVTAGRTRPPSWRTAQLQGVERLLKEEEQAFVTALGEDLGRPPADAFLADVGPTAAEARFARKHLRSWMRPTKVRLPITQRPGSGWVQYEPLGAVLIIGPWNYPAYLTLGPLIGALAAGNTVVIKPSELAPATSALLARVLPRYLDAEAVRVIEGDAAVTQSLLAAGFDHAFFTGGTEIGRKVMAAAAPTLTPVTLELGGKSPVLIAPDAAIDVAARRITWIKLLNSGQTCIAPDYVLAHHSVRDALVEKMIGALREFRSDQPAGAGQRIVNARQFDRLTAALAATRGRVVHGGGSDRASLTLEPTIVVDPDPDEPLMQEEIFGPILPVLSSASVEESVRFVNARPKPLALYVFTESAELGRRVVDTVPAGGAVINHIALHCTVPQLPFGGVGASGMGAYHGEWGFQTFSHRKAVLSRPTRPDPQAMYPPYSDRMLALMRRMI